MSNSEGSIPTLEQLNESRLRQWHQGGEALLTFENLRSWINATGLALFTARPGQLPAPAPSLVEAVLGAPNANPVMADMEQAKSLLARLVTEGIAVPLNLLGTPGETPDFVVSATVFAYVFTLRGDKAWKQPPATAGALRVSPLALAAYEMLTERVTLSAYDLATQLGKEVTESAVLRALNELWAHLRVLPVPQMDGAATLWELTGARFTKIMKAGANAGQPSALSALISLYLNTAIVATEEEIETFLSPLAARSRIRDVVHALMAARQLETLAIEGKTVLHVAGELPAFLAPAGSILIDAEASVDAEPVVGSGEPTIEPIEGAERISKFVPKPKKVGTGFVKKFVAKPGFGSRPGFGTPDRERRPFAREDRPNRPDRGERAVGRPSFTKPWQEGKPAGSGGEERPARSYPTRPRMESGEWPAFGGKPGFGGERGARPAGGFAAKSGFGEDRPPRRTFDRGGAPDRPAFGRSANPGEGRPPRREFTPRPERTTGGRTSGERHSGERPAGARPFGDRPAFGGARKPGSFSARPQGGPGERRPFVPRESGAGRPGAKFADGFSAAGGGSASSDRRSRTAGPPFRKFDAPRGDRPVRTDRSDRPDRPAGTEGAAGRPPRPGGFAGKPASGGFAGKRPGAKFAGKPGAGKFVAGKPAGTFDKFKNHAKPFGNRPPARKWKPEEGEPTA